MVQLEDLQAFVQAAERGTFSAAAEAMLLSQPSVSRRIARLERQLGGALFERDNRRTPKLSRFGERMLPWARRLLDAHLNLLESARRALSGDDQFATIAVSTSIAEVSLHCLLQRLDEESGKVDVRLIERRPGEEIEQAILSDAAELGLMTSRGELPRHLDSLVITRLPIVVLASTTKYWNTEDPIDWAEVRKLPLLLATRREQALGRWGESDDLDVVHEEGTPGVLRAMTLEGLGVTIAAGVRSSPGLTARPLTMNGSLVVTDLHLLWPRGARLGEAATRLLDQVRRTESAPGQVSGVDLARVSVDAAVEYQVSQIAMVGS